VYSTWWLETAISFKACIDEIYCSNHIECTDSATRIMVAKIIEFSMLVSRIILEIIINIRLKLNKQSNCYIFLFKF